MTALPKTLAGMTPAEQMQCVGMWCDFHPGEFVKEGKEPQLGIIADWHLNREEATILNAGDTVSRMWSAGKNVTPRFDLPRAWNADGTPPKMKTEFARANWDYIDEFMSVFPDVDECLDEEAFIDPNRNYRDGEAVAARFCTEWEPYQEQENPK